MSDGLLPFTASWTTDILLIIAVSTAVVLGLFVLADAAGSRFVRWRRRRALRRNLERRFP